MILSPRHHDIVDGFANAYQLGIKADDMEPYRKLLLLTGEQEEWIEPAEFEAARVLGLDRSEIRAIFGARSERVINYVERGIV